MKRTQINLVLAGLLLAGGFVTNAAMAQQSANATASTSAVVVKPIAIAKGSDLSFGRLTSSAGTVAIAASDGARTGTAATMVAVTGTGNAAPGRAVFNVTGEKGLTYSIEGGTGEIDLANGENKLKVTLTGVYVGSASAIAAAGTLSAEGADTLGVGGSITTTAETASGTYTNAAGISITVAYN